MPLPQELPPQADDADGTDKGNGRHDLFTHRIVVISLGLTVIFTGLIMTVLECLGHNCPPALANLGSTAIGALALTLGSIMRKN